MNDRLAESADLEEARHQRIQELVDDHGPDWPVPYGPGTSLAAWGLAAAGQAGVVRVLELLEEEITIAMGLMGVTSIDQLNPSYVRQAEPVNFPHEMSSFVNLTEGQVR